MAPAYAAARNPCYTLTYQRLRQTGVHQVATLLVCCCCVAAAAAEDELLHAWLDPDNTTSLLIHWITRLLAAAGDLLLVLHGTRVYSLQYTSKTGHKHQCQGPLTSQDVRQRPLIMYDHHPRPVHISAVSLILLSLSFAVLRTTGTLPLFSARYCFLCGRASS